MSDQELLNVVSEVAPHLYGFKAEGKYLVHEFGYKLLFYKDWNKSKIIGLNSTYRHKIGCSFSKSPKKIAADINRRLIVDYKKDFKQTKKNKVERDLYELNQNKLLEAISIEACGEIRSDYSGYKSGDRQKYIDAGSLNIRQRREHFNFEIELGFKNSLELIKFLKKMKVLNLNNFSKKRKEFSSSFLRKIELNSI